MAREPYTLPGPNEQGAGYRPTTSGTWQSGIKAPDMSNVIQIAAKAGRLEGKNAFMEQLLQLRAEKKKTEEEQAEERNRAAADLGNDPDSPGFWSKMGQFAADGLENTIDVLSRGLYGVAGAYDHIQDESIKYDKQDLSFFDKIQADLGALPEGMMEVWKGLSGEDKTTFGQVISDEIVRDNPDRAAMYQRQLADYNKIKDKLSPEAQQTPPQFAFTTGERMAIGMGGLAADIVLDPLNFVGVGLVTKPLKAGREVSSITDDLVDEVATLGITRKGKDGVDVPLTHNDIRVLLGGDFTRKVPRGLSKKQQRQWRNAHSTPGRQRKPKSTEAAQVRARIQGLEVIRKKLRETPGVSDPGLDALKATVQKHEDTLDNMVNDYGRKAYAQALNDFDNRPGIGSPVGSAKVVKETVENLTTVAQIKKATRARQFFRSKKGNAAKNQATIASAFKSILNDPNVSSGLKKDIEAWAKATPGKKDETTLGKIIQSDPEWRRVRDKIRATSKSRDKIKNAPGAAQSMDAQVAAGRRTSATTAAYEELAAIEARIIRDIVNGDINESMMRGIAMYGEEYGALQGRKAELERLLEERVGSLDDANNWDMAEQGAATGGDRAEIRELMQELEEVDADLASMRADYQLRHPDKANFDSRYADFPRVKQSDVSPEDWENLKSANINKEAERLYEQYYATAARETREGGQNARLHKMYGGKDDKQFRVEVDGKQYTQSELKQAIKDGKIESTKADWEASKRTIDKDGSFTPVEKITFDRIFKQQHGISHYEASQLKALDEGRFVTLHGNKLTKEQFVQKAIEDPDEVSKTNYMGISMPKDMFPDEIAERIGYKYIGFSKFKAALSKELEEAGTFKGKEIDEKVLDEWQGIFKEFVRNDNLNEEVQDTLRRAWDWRFRTDKNAAKGVETDENITNKPLPQAKKDELWARAKKDATTKVNSLKSLEDLREGAYGVRSRYEKTRYEEDPNVTVTPEDINQEALREARREYAEGVARLKMQKFVDTDEGYRARATQMDFLKSERDRRITAANEALEEAKRARKAMADRIDEQLTLNMIMENVAHGRNYLRVNFAGIKVADITAPEALIKATEAMSRLPILKAANRVWADSFHPASKLEPEMNLARLRAQARTPDIIKHHLDSIRQSFSKFKPDERRDAFDLIKRGAPPVGEAQTATKAFFDDYAKHTTRRTFIGKGDDAETLTIRDLNHYLPDEFKFVHPKPKGNPDHMMLRDAKEILQAMRNMRRDTDPMKAMWHMAIAAEQAMAYKAMQQTVKKSFGVKREMPKGPASKGQTPSDRAMLIEELNTRHGWVTNRDIGDDYYFDPEVADQIERLMDIMKPARINELMRTYDKVQRFWKSAVTVYNPGYYVRNGIGETIMGMIDGLANPKYYSRSAQIIKYAMPDDVKEALKTLEPWARHSTKNQQKVRKVVRLKGGKELSVEDVWVLYSEVGLKSGFISSEYEHFFPAANTARATPVGQVATKINDNVRQGGEKYEDYFRLAHFMYRMEKSGFRDPLAAAKDAAQHVRKYHFDYTDFTPTEKAVFMRLFPFYKWTRKSLPLMAGLLFTKPGAVTAYPKVMQNASYMTGGTNPLEDDNGLLPNYEDVTPEWMQNLFAYPMGRDEAEAMTYMNVATPQMDIYKLMQNPVSATIGMMSPLYKVPIEQGIGRQIDPDFDMELTDDPKTEDVNEAKERRTDHLLRTTPAGSLLNNIYDNSGDGDSAVFEPGASPLDEKMTSFLSGLGFYENNEKRQKGETFRRNMEKAGY